MTMSTTLITSRDPKGLHWVNLCEAVYNKAKLDEDQAQQLNENGGEFQVGLKELIDKFSISNQFSDEEVESSYGYLSGYQIPVPVTDQIDILRSHWPQLNPDRALHYMNEVYPKLQVPNWIEGPFALIRPGFFSDVYREEVEEVFKALEKALDGKFVNYRKGELGPEYLRQNARTISMMKQITEQQPNSDIIIVPEQFGIRHRGRSVRRAKEVFIAAEFGEGTKNTGTMIITNPNRLQHYNDLWIDCAGDEYSPSADGRFDGAPSFRFFGGGVGFGAGWSVSALDLYGSGSAFLPQQNLENLDS